MSARGWLPQNATPFEEAFLLGVSTDAYLGPAISSLHGIKLINPPASFLPYLVYEYGLGELSPYVPNIYELIRDGIEWQRVRGTPASVAKGLGWLSYGGAIEEEPTRRRFWNAWQVALNRVRSNEQDLRHIEGVCSLSDCERSDFRRGFNGYDVRAGEASWSQASQCMTSDDSGVRIDGGAAKWSFGRRVNAVHDMTQAELEALGVWTEPTGDEQLVWGDFPWGDFPWGSAAAFARSALMLENTGAGPAWAVFRDADGEVLFYRRCRVRRPVVAAVNGVYRIGASRFNPAPAAAADLYVEALTGFGDGYGSTAASVGFILSAEPAPGVRRGLDVLAAGELQPAGPVVGETPVTIEFGRTVRECVAMLLRF